MLGIEQDLLGRAVLHDPAGVHDDDLVDHLGDHARGRG